MKPLYLLAFLLCGSWAWGQDIVTTPPTVIPTSDVFMVYGSGARLLLSCKTNDPPTGCVLAEGATLDEAISVMLETQQKMMVNRCGEWGKWIEDQNGNVMYRRRNPPCPKHPPKEPVPINYSICELRAIGMEHIPEGAMPRTLENPAAPPPWTEQELKGFCARRK